MNPKKRKIYVAGAYSADNVLDVLDNMRIGIQTASDLFEMGYSPFCPWLDHHFCLHIPKEYLTVERFYEYSIDFLDVCDALLVTKNQRNMTSKGTNAEIDRANTIGIPVFYSIKDLQDWARS